MTNNRDLLKEAIADAKSVKETAIANAKLALEEAFTPYLKNQLSAKLQEMDDEDDMDEPLKKEEVREVKAEEDDIDEINLDELLAEMELEDDDLTKTEEVEVEMDDEEMEMDDEEMNMDDEDVDLEDLSEDDLKAFIEDVIKDMVASGEIEPGDDFSEEEDMEVEVEDVEDVDDEDMDMGIEIEMEEGSSKMDDDDVKMEAILKEIEELKCELQEVNLLNAKLLYTNKIFKAKNLTESKKISVLKAFDKATDVKQTKIIYETLNEGIVNSITNPTVNESVKRGLASKANGLKPMLSKQPILESNQVYERMQKLAGLI
jgi:hypothetical protein